jgi:hypothetical protein
MRAILGVLEGCREVEMSMKDAGTVGSLGTVAGVHDRAPIVHHDRPPIVHHDRTPIAQTVD